MLQSMTSTYKEIAKHFPELAQRLPKTHHKRQILIQMAQKGEPRPSQKTKIGKFLSEITKPSSKSYDPEFHDKLKAIRPDWFLSQTQIAGKKKDELLTMARNGEPRPSHDKTRLGQALSNYTRKSSGAYDPEFDRKIRRLRPDWFTP